METRSLDDPQVHTGSYDSLIECLKDIISGLKAEIERHDRECNLTRQETERLSKKENELWKATKDLDEVRQFLSTVKTEIDSMHRMMPASEEAANVDKKNPRSSNDSDFRIGDEQGEMAKLRESVSLLEARMEGVLDEAAELQTENKRLKDELEKGRSENLSLEAKLRDEDLQLNSQLSDLIMKVNKNSEVLNLFSDHFKSDVSQVKVLRGRLEAFCAELQEIETRVDICADELQLASVHVLPTLPKYGISHEGSEGRVAEKVRCLIEQGLLKVAGRRSHPAIEKPLEPNKAGLDTGKYTESVPTPSFGHPGGYNSSRYREKTLPASKTFGNRYVSCCTG
ncbi:hypothetical protein FOMG_19556 [Fusarium oxysporum f. sp. melonis 26406]|uniref:Uncharacterized protein n=1 Tax=Fusarium oxysporum f. sp. melonis 26406 TaxID=1089452 RepID=W9YWZ2_FUSOX|nr:hypothetical protein FOMG_19556 [Fusarium oxysporum f. sp. melonis 26406]